jgi:hypothetical protein
MKKLFATLILGIVSSITFAQSEVYVNGYYKSNGTYVQSHYRTAPNSTINDNWSTYSNVNPHTGEVGTIQPEQTYNSYQNSSNSTFNSNLDVDVSYFKPTENQIDWDSILK